MKNLIELLPQIELMEPTPSNLQEALVALCKALVLNEASNKGFWSRCDFCGTLPVEGIGCPDLRCPSRKIV